MRRKCNPNEILGPMLNNIGIIIIFSVHIKTQRQSCKVLIVATRQNIKRRGDLKLAGMVEERLGFLTYFLTKWGLKKYS